MRLKLFHGKSLNSYFMHKVFGWPSFYESLKDPPQKIRHRETKEFKKVVIVCYPKFFRYQKISELQGPPKKFFGAVRQKRSTKSWYPYYPKNFETRINLKQTRVAHDVFRQFGTKKLRRKNVTTPSFTKTFSELKLFWKLKTFPHDVFRNCETKNSQRKIVKLPHYA